MIYSTISQKVMDGFGRNLVDRCVVWQGRLVSILVNIRIRIWIREFLSDSASLPLPPKWRRLCFHPFLSVCVQDISKSCWWIRMEFCGQVWCSRLNWLDFSEDPNPDPTTRILKVILQHWEKGPKMISSTISQKVDGFGWNLVDPLGVRLGRIDSILVKIRIRMRIW